MQNFVFHVNGVQIGISSSITLQLFLNFPKCQLEFTKLVKIMEIDLDWKFFEMLKQGGSRCWHLWKGLGIKSIKP
jgi:hypothetical protein